MSLVSRATVLLALSVSALEWATPGAMPAAAAPQSAEEPAPFTPEELEQIVAPIALYPDALLSQILLASTYPLEVVQAERWIGGKPGLAGAALEEALRGQTWDPSVKAMCAFPTVLKSMSDDLDWTRDLGDAFLGQREELMETVQRMRARAHAAGTLRTNVQHRVVRTGDTIVIESASPDVVYVPVYSPLVVYGPGWHYAHWHYPYWYGPPGYGGGFLTFGPAYPCGSWCWAHCDWHHPGVVVDPVAFQHFAVATNSTRLPANAAGVSKGRVEWSHDPFHRLGLGYRSPRVAERFGAPTSTRRPATDPRRGIDRTPKFPELPRPLPSRVEKPAPPAVPPPLPRSRPPPIARPRPKDGSAQASRSASRIISSAISRTSSVR